MQASVTSFNVWNSSLRFDGQPASFFVKQDAIKVSIHLITNLRGEFSCAGGQEKYFLSASGSQFVVIEPAKFLKIGQKVNILWPK